MSELGLRDESGAALRLFMLDGRPATDSEGVPLLNICGNPLVTLLVKKGGTEYCDLKGSPLTDRLGRTQNDAGYCPTDAPPVLEQRRVCSRAVYALDGHPLAGVDGVPLLSSAGRPLIVFNPKGRPVTDLEGRDVTDSTGVVLHSAERPYLSKDKQPLRIFDELGRPLTDENGFPFTDIIGSPLIHNDDYKNPIFSLKGHSLRDADGQTPWEEGFDLTKSPKYNIIHKAIVCKNKENGIAFDAFGHPLTDMYGFPLFDIYGIPLVKRINKIWTDVHKNPVIIIEKSIYDCDGLKKLKNSKGTAVRIYDKSGYPLTDEDGIPLFNAQGVFLTKFNELGEPISDFRGYPIYDCRGNQYGSLAFRPCRDFENNPARDLTLKFKKTGCQYFDAYGMPLTNFEGIPLVNAYQELMIMYNEDHLPLKDAYGCNIFDKLGLPVGCSMSDSLKGPTGEPVRLYNKLGKPLTDIDGNILNSVNNIPSLNINYVGKVECDWKGYPLHDADGCPMSLPNDFLPTKSPSNDKWTKSLRNLDGSPLVMYDITGEPLTDNFGRILLDNSGTPLITISREGFIQERNGEFLLDTDGHGNFKISGRALKEKIALYDKHDRPLIAPSRYILRLRTGKEVIKFDISGFPVNTIDGGKIYDSQGRQIFTPLSDMYVVPKYESVVVYNGELQLFDCEDRPLLDVTGEILYTSKGVPLLNTSEGLVTSDALGRPVFDGRGIPVCNPGGMWRDREGSPYRLYDKESYPVTDARGKELLDVGGRPLVRRDRFGRPVYDMEGNVLSDAEGRHVTSEEFLGTLSPPQRRTSSLMESREVPLCLYDRSGKPLTDDCGKPLETSKGKPILDLTKGVNRITDLNGCAVYDSRRVPVGCSESTPILTREGEPIVLYNKDGNPLMTREGIPIKKVNGSTLLDFDQFGRPIYTEGLYDFQGKAVEIRDCSLTGPATSRVSMMSLEGRPVKVFDRSGRPLTDEKGNVLFKSNGEPLNAGSWGDISSHPTVSGSLTTNT